MLALTGEIEGFLTVKSILRSKVDASRVFHRDTQSYLNIILDDNIRKQICRLWLNGSKKYIGLFDDQKKEVRYEITSLDDIYKYSEQLIAAADAYNALGKVA